MIVAHSIDLWQKDAFFSAAEEVQESVDILESTYRTWVRERREGLAHEDWDELCRELQTALGTAKWQLEEFDKAVSSSHRSRSEDKTTIRHRQFVAALENQISHVEAALREYFNQNGNQRLQWVNLDEEECADLAIFLTGTLSAIKHEYVEPQPATNNSVWKKQYWRKDTDLNSNTGCDKDCMDEIECLKDVTIHKDGSHVIELEAKESTGTRDGSQDRSFGSRRTWSSTNFGALKILIPDDDEQKKTLRSRIEVTPTPKEKGSKPAFWNWNELCGEHAFIRGSLPSCIQMRGISKFSQLFGCIGVFRKQVQSPQRLQFNCSVRIMLALMLTMFLIVPFVLYST